MSADDGLARDIAQRQVAMFGMFVGPGLYTTRAALAEATGVPASTLKEWGCGAAMPIHGLLRLSRVLPGAAIGMLTETVGKRLVDVEAQSSNWDGVQEATAELTYEIIRAKNDGFVDHREHAKLQKLAHKVAVVTQGAAIGGEG